MTMEQKVSVSKKQGVFSFVKMSRAICMLTILDSSPLIVRRPWAVPLLPLPNPMKLQIMLPPPSDTFV